MTTFDDILPEIGKVLAQENLAKLRPIIINRDLNGRIRLILKESTWKAMNKTAQTKLVKEVSACLGKHKYAPDRLLLSDSDFEAVKQDLMLFETELEPVKQGAPHFLLKDFLPEHFKNLKNLKEVTVVDRLVTETDWSTIAPLTNGPHRMVFFSIKGGVGRSTALAAATWSLAQAGKRVLVLDLDLESPGLSSALLPKDRRPLFGVTDWLVEDLVDNGDAVFGDMFAASELSNESDILVVPAHGLDPKEYLVKLGRAWMPKIDDKGAHEAWSARLRRLLDKLEAKHHPDVILIDSRAGIDEAASACVTELGAKTIFLFAIDGDQTWTGYDILFQHWRRTGKADSIRDRLQMVGAMIPDDEHAKDYFDGLCEEAYKVFCCLYDDIPAKDASGIEFNFEKNDLDAPHYPWPVRWNRGFAALQSLHSRFQDIDDDAFRAVFGELTKRIHIIVDSESES